MDLEGVLDWEESSNICKKSVSLSPEESGQVVRVKRNRVELTTLAFHSHSVFVTSEVEKSNFYRDLEGGIDWEIKTEKKQTKSS